MAGHAGRFKDKSYTDLAHKGTWRCAEMRVKGKKPRDLGGQIREAEKYQRRTRI